ncbi:hypothetical protein H9L13_00010 [Sphingomonas lutea]|uniref:Uncharacterized protein n=1 Tax=Sphingomonas lutea TaxID=1045317 RepID=A0A7G9SHS7_9SPHN|nr:hypothetical protein [Sphingomonas lutea]QNN67402.1 hypothetical protein H9L13_00010 [Sphingomonas lutea]
MSGLTTSDILKIAAALALIVAGIWQYRRRSGTGENASYGSQSGVLLLVVGIILMIYAVGGLEYRPSPAEQEALSQ